MDPSSSKLNEVTESAFEPSERLDDSPNMTNHLQVWTAEDEYYLQKIQKLVNSNMKFFAREIEESRRMKRESKRPMKSSLSDDEYYMQDEESRRMKRESKRPMKSSLSDDEFYNQDEESRRMKRESKRPMKTSSSEDEFGKQVKESKKRKIKIISKQCPVKNLSSSSSSFEDEDELKRKMKKQKKKIQKEIENRIKSEPLISNEVTKRLKAFISNVLNGSDIMPVIQKLLYSSDIIPNQNRLSMPINQLIKTSEFLTPQEKSTLDTRGEIEVPLLGPTLQMYKLPMKLMTWNMVSTKSYILKTNWNSFVDNEKDLKENSIVQVWSFRKDQKLCLALAVVEGPDPRFSVEEGSSSSS